MVIFDGVKDLGDKYEVSTFALHKNTKHLKKLQIIILSERIVYIKEKVGFIKITIIIMFLPKRKLFIR